MSGRFRLGIFSVHGLSSFSRIPHYLVQALRQEGAVEVIVLSDGTRYSPPLWKRVVKRVERQLGHDYLWEKEVARCRHISTQLDRVVGERAVDAVLVFGSESCAYSETSVPLYCWADSIFGSRIDLYPDQVRARLSQATLREGALVQQRALDRLRRLFISSRWAVARAVQRFGYQLPDAKVEVVGIGANLPEEPSPSSVRVMPSLRTWFAWVGNFWERKGGEFAVDVVADLRARGLDARLDVVGNTRPSRVFDWLRVRGNLSYEDPVQFATLSDTYARSVALLLPSLGDTTPLAICEAFAFGRPVVATPIGGIPEMIHDGRTGLLLERTSPSDWAERLADVVKSGLLWEMRPACRASFETRLNWRVISRRMLAIMKGAG